MKLTGKNIQSPRLITGISWGITGLIVLALLGFVLWRVLPLPVSAAPQPTPTEEGVTTDLPVMNGSGINTQAIVRHIALKTAIDKSVNYRVVQYSVKRGDSVFGIADLYKIKPETVYWANYQLFQGSPDSIKVGQVLQIPPVDGVYYEWKDGDSIDSVANEYDVSPEVILNWPGNNLDLTDPEIPVGSYVLIQGAEKNDQPLFIQTVTVASGPAAAACGGGYSSRGFFGWPAPNHFLSGYNFGDNGHRGVDIAATEGTPIFAADNGVVTMAQIGWNYGYGNVIQIDHGNGFVTVYAHLSQINVQVCDPVSAGAVIGAAGNTGNSFGAHLHFEVRTGGVTINPWNVLPPP